jgi:regulator of sigma E protease
MIGLILLVVLIFGLLVFVHELGHFVAARMSGIEVEEFGFGFPPRIFGIKKGKTLYSLNWIPLGGFVRLRGEDAADNQSGSFGAAPFKRKVLVLVAGVLMNALVAYLIMVGVVAAGLPQVLQQEFNLPAGNAGAPRIMALAVGEGSPAAQAGIVQGELLIKADDHVFVSEEDVVAYNRDHAGQTINLTVENKGEQRQVSVRLRDAEQGAKQGYLGVTPGGVANISYGWQAPLVAAELTGKLVVGTFMGFVDLIVNLVRSAQVSQGVVGPVGVVSILGSVVAFGWRYVLFFVAQISVSLAVINVLPIPALDGGRLMLVVARRILKRPISAELEAKIHTVGFVALLMFMAVVTYFDLKRLP